MRFMSREQETAEKFLPGLDAELAGVPIDLLESPESPGLNLVRDAGGTGLLIDKAAGGLGASLVDAVHVHRLIGSRSPSLAIALNMHSCTVAAIPPGPASEELLALVGSSRLYLASAFAEGVPGASVITPKLQGARTDGGWILNGNKKPCSLSRSMDILTASVLLRDGDDDGDLALVTVPAASPGISVRPLSDRPGVFAGSETDEVVLVDVFVPDEAVSFFGKTDELNATLSAAWLTFEVLVSACYLGMASGLVRQVLERGAGTSSERAALVGDLDAAMGAVESVALEITSGSGEQTTVARSLNVRYHCQRVIEQTSAVATELLGGVAFMVGNSSTLYTACRGLAFHPPSRAGIADALDRYIAGEELYVA